MLTGSSTNYLRLRGHGHATVTTVELFFDLVFVFAVTQLSHTLLEHFTPLGMLQVALLFAAVWWAWINTSWVTNWLDPRFSAVRLLLFALMLAGLFLSMSIPKAFTTHGLAFALGFAATQLIRDGFMLWALRHHHRGNFRNFQRIFTWHATALVFWIAGGFADPQTRLLVWLVALAIDTLGPSLFFRVPGLGRSTLADWDVEGGHLAERCGLFVIIALGESILITGATFANLNWDALTTVAFAQAFAGSIAMWWIYFNIGAERAAEKIAHAEDPGRMGRLAYTYLHLPIVAGIIVCAVADELVLAHPSGHSETKLLIAGIGGPAIYLIGNALFKHTIHSHLPLSHLVGLGLLAILAAVSGWLTPLAVCTGATASLIVVAIWETRSLTPRRTTMTNA
ncbi:MAG TPA: low temperature requirement protein A [Pseudolabrys sp.]|nr:low temperature requirement protein A [Pseudolabrys sp.]